MPTLILTYSRWGCSGSTKRKVTLIFTQDQSNQVSADTNTKLCVSPSLKSSHDIPDLKNELTFVFGSMRLSVLQELCCTSVGGERERSGTGMIHGPWRCWSNTSPRTTRIIYWWSVRSQKVSGNLQNNSQKKKEVTFFDKKIITVFMKRHHVSSLKETV